MRAPWSGVVNEVPVEIGQAAFSMAGREIAQIVALDPMLAVVEVAERKLAGIKVGDHGRGPPRHRPDGDRARSASSRKTASPATRTYRVEVEIPNADGDIPDGITAEVDVQLAPAPAARVPRSALTFSSNGELGVRTVDADGKVAFVPVTVVEDEQQFMWVAGVADGARVIVAGPGLRARRPEGRAGRAPSAPKTAAR